MLCDWLVTDFEKYLYVCVISDVFNLCILDTAVLLDDCLSQQKHGVLLYLLASMSFYCIFCVGKLHGSAAVIRDVRNRFFYFVFGF